MAITSSHVAFSRAFDTTPLAWKNPVAKIEPHPFGVILFDEAFDKKSYSYQDLLARLPEAEATEQRMALAINCVYINPASELCWIYDYRELLPTAPASEKLTHVRSMLQDFAADTATPFATVLLKNCYATEQNMLLVAQLGKTYWCPVRANRLFRGHKKDDAHLAVHLATHLTEYLAVKDIALSDAELKHGKLVSLKSFPKDQQVKLFRIADKNGTMTHIITNQLQQDDTADYQLIAGLYWKADNAAA